MKAKRLEWHDVAEKLLLAGSGPAGIAKALKKTNPEWVVKPNQVSKFKQRLARQGADFPKPRLSEEETKKKVSKIAVGKKLDNNTLKELEAFIARCKGEAPEIPENAIDEKQLEDLALNLTDDKEPV
tara:strand:- start:553 stop:933 length:381 start_codon:yes stop_codon:yes gene_type:complete